MLAIMKRLILIYTLLVCNLAEEYVPKYLQNRYGNLNSNNVQQQPPPSYGQKTVSKTNTKTASSSTSAYKGGCDHAPTTPMNSGIVCSKFSGCRAKCTPDYLFPNGQDTIYIVCNNGKWQTVDMEWDRIPNCEPTCLPKCENNGICVAPNQCDCPENFQGPHCQFENRPCLNYPPMPLNAKRSCRSTSCTVQCLPGHRFPDTTQITTMLCKDGNWIPANPNYQAIPDCLATCEPPCMNGGKCMQFNSCQCPQEFRGPQCQYNVNTCSARHLKFNGGYNCTGNMNELTCQLSCPDGVHFEYEPHPLYTCSYATGTFTPSDIPQCVYGENLEVIPLGATSHTYYKTLNNSFQINAHSEQEIDENDYDYHAFATSNKVHRKKIESVVEDANFDFPNMTEIESVEHHFVTTEEKQPKSGVCFTWNGLHFKTFDGNIFSIDTPCFHTLVRDVVDDIFNILVKNNNCHKFGTVCYRIIKFFVQDKEYVLQRNDDGKPVFMTPHKILPIPGQLPGLRAEMVGKYIVITLDSIGVKIKWDTYQMLQIEVSQALWNRTEGLCGVFDGHKENDFKSKDGEMHDSTLVFASSWLVEDLDEPCLKPATEVEECTNFMRAREAEEFCHSIVKNDVFKPCYQIADIAEVQKSCTFDYCNCKEEGSVCACTAFDVYARTCMHRGVKHIANWRNEEICPMKCSDGRIYMTCAPPHGQPTCGASLERKDESICEEGCYCPEGTVLHDDKCITKDQCPCRLRGKEHPPGSSVSKQCNTCTCFDGQWLCTEVSCGARCAAIGDPHYITFDGKRYDFMGQCTYVLMQSDNITVEGENVACSGAVSEAMNFPAMAAVGMPSCTKAVIIRYAGQVIKLKQSHEVTINSIDIDQLPTNVKGINIRIISSLFIVVELPNKVEVWWDGTNRAYIDVPSTFYGKTTGLCGTFNNNQQDDFLTPENDIEKSVVPFANKWKTLEKCNDIPEKRNSHPCDINIQNKAKAEKMCSKLKSQTFKPCHDFVDPIPFYEDCLYDVCSCELKISGCLCPMLAAYAQECALAGVKIPWRVEVHECGITCPAGQVYQICGNSCTRTCNDVRNTNCRQQCVEGCNCPEGMALDEYGECIPIGRCKCQHYGIEFPAGYKEVRPATKGMELCTCINAVWECKVATPSEIKKYPGVDELQSKCDSTRNFVFTTCEPVEPLTCKNMHDPNYVSAGVCHSGCECKEGYVLDSRNRRCVKPSECPCHHGGRSYKENSIVQSDCNTCKCKKGKWECTNRQCTSECAAWGDSHFQTFDGKMYDYQGQCDYVLSKGSLSGEGSFDVTIQNVPCGSLGVSCSKSITVKVSSANDHESIVLTRGQSNLHSLNQIYKTFTVRSVDLYVIIEAADLGLSILWDRGTRVYVKLDPRWKTKVKGLCGNYNNDAHDDFQTPSGGIAEASSKIFGDSWKLQEYCPETEEITDTCKLRPERKIFAVKKCGILKSKAFAACHSEVPVEDYLERCIFDSCACDQGGDCECLCTAVAAYAQACNNHGISIKWRSQELCPIQCNEMCSKYSSCVSTCPPETCDNLLLSTPLSKLCKEETCVEGCQPKVCPPDHVYSNSSLLECVPRSACRPVCLEIGNVTYYEGDVMESDDCQTCYCSRQKKICKGHTCRPVEVIPTSHHQGMQEIICTQGWTSWINQDSKLYNKESKKIMDIEPIPNDIIMNNLKGDVRCKQEEIADIQCRTVGTHMSAKETGFDVECDLNKGLICLSQPGQRPCPDFEIRLFCKCEETFMLTTEASAEEITTILPCTFGRPHEQHPDSCHKFYQCVPYYDGGKLVEKTCGQFMLFNPNSMTCDWPANVVAIRPECEFSSHTDLPIEEEEVVDLEADLHPAECPPGEVKDECAIHCDKLCLAYSYVLREEGLCTNKQLCESACVSAVKKNECPPGMLWANNNTCVSIQDCMCHSHDGDPVRPGEIYKESHCMICQCLNNYYTCDTSSCNEQILIPGITVSDSVDVEFITTTKVPLIKTTVTPPMECPEENIKDLILSKPLPDGAFTASSILNENFEPYFSRINSKVAPHSGGSWSPSPNDKTPYLIVDLEEVEPIYGVVIKGSPLYDEYVTSFKVLYSTRENDVWNHILDMTHEPNVFRGSVDGNTPVRHIFYQPVEARFVKFVPLTWNGAAALRVDILGCSEVTLKPQHDVTMPAMCDDPMGINDGTLGDHQIEVSSEYGPSNTKKELKLGSKNAWRPMTNSPHEYIKIDFMELRNITGFKTKGGPSGWVTTFHVRYSQTGTGHWNKIIGKLNVERDFLGNYDENSIHQNDFKIPILASHLQIIPTKWHRNIELRLEILGCYETYPTQPSYTTLPPSECNTCPGVISSVLEIEACRCKPELWWNGEACVTRSECPCMIGHIPYQVGALFEMEDCSQCICKLGGQPLCESKKCDKCPEGLRSTVTSTCGCACRPCEEDTVLCPTSNTCINATSWCDGVQDCPDDENDCSTIPPSTMPTTIFAETETKKSLSPLETIKCEVLTCPEGFKAVLRKDRSHITTMFSSGRTYNKESSIKSQIKGDKKISSQIVPEASKEILDEVGCPVYVCVRKKPIIPLENKPCPPIECPSGLIPEYTDDSKSKERCPSYDCIMPPQPDAICNVTGRSFNTFDNTEYNYDICNHILVTDMKNFEWEVSIQKICEELCTRQLTIVHSRSVFILHADLSVEYNGYNYTVSQSKKLSSNTNLFSISRLGNVLLFVSNQYGFWVIWNKQGNIKIGVSIQLKHQVAGLCGYYNNIKNDDKLRPDRTIAKTSVEFGDSWAAPSSLESCDMKVCPVHLQNKAWEICNQVKSQVLSDCAKALDVEAFISRCLETTCLCLEKAEHNNTAVETCRCNTLETFVVDCMTADSTIELLDWRTIHDCPIYCESPLIYHDCYRRRCEPTCESMSDPGLCSKMPNVCFPGCYCPPGLVRKGDSCIKSSNCKDCECNILPHLQYVTYDERNFTINGNCVYIMSRDLLDKYQDDHVFQVLITNHPCQDEPEKMCVGKVTILYQGHKIHIYYDMHRNNLKLIVDGEWIDDFTEIEEWLDVRQTKSKHLKISLIKAQVEVSVYFPSLGVSVKAPSHKYGNKLEGLCGNCNKDPDDDMTTRPGFVTDNVEELGLSWLYDKLPGMTNETCAQQVEEVCEPLPIDQDPCVQLVDVLQYGQCHPILDPLMFIEWCRKDTCGHHPERACNSIGSYARECLSNGFCVDWHNELCPAATCNDDQEYRPCETSAPRTCDYVLNPGNHKKYHNVIVEGCFCPEGKVLMNNTCVDEDVCFACDDEGHHLGDVWKKDACTTCECVGINMKCEKQHCPTVDTICEIGHMPIKLAKQENECCDKVICVPAATELPTCDPPQPISCASGQVMTLISKPNGCQEFVCQCKPVEDCEHVDIASAQASAEEGMFMEIDESGCCPVIKSTCKPELCPKTPECLQFHKPVNQNITGICCPKYTCEAPKSCIVDLKYTNAQDGGERERNMFEKQTVLKEVNDTWSDGPCRECHCYGSPSTGYHSACSITECPAIQSLPDYNDYEYQYENVSGQCCPNIKRLSCKDRGVAYGIRDSWIDEHNPCLKMECHHNREHGVQKITHVISCDETCDLGFQYFKTDQTQCCGQCKAVACVVNGIERSINDAWTSEDFCTNNKCVDLDGSIQIQSVQIVCPNGPTEEDLRDFQYESNTHPGECCPRFKKVACRNGSNIFEIGSAWPSTDGNKCKNVTCDQSENGDLIKRESFQTCNEDCPRGWTYNESLTECCGECVQTACILGDDLKYHGENWTTDDNCTTYTCEKSYDQYIVTSQQESCPELGDCEVENIYIKGCCAYCNVTSSSYEMCAPIPLELSRTVGLITTEKENHGLCKNYGILNNFTECIGTCSSSTKFNSRSGMHESICSCCQAVKYEPLLVDLTCDDGYKFQKNIAVPSKCSCEGCINAKSPIRYATKT